MDQNSCSFGHSPFAPDRRGGPRGDVSINVGDPYSGTLTFRSAPDMMLIPNSNVYTVRGTTDYDLYRYDGNFYLVDDGNWYRAQSWRGPFNYVRRESVPRAVV